MEIRFTTNYSAADKLLLAGGETNPSGTSGYGLEWRPTEHHVLAIENGTSVAHVGLLRHRVRVGEATLPVFGIGGVLTHPAYRNAGLARMAMDEASKWAVRELDVQFGLLFCREAMLPWYERQGWTRVADTVWIEQSQGTTASPLPTMTKSMTKAAWPPGEVWLDSLPW